MPEFPEPYAAILRGRAEKSTGYIEIMTAYHTNYLQRYLKRFFDIECTAQCSYLFGRQRILVTTAGVYELDESQELLRFLGRGCEVEDNEWVEMPDGEGDW